MSCAWPRRVADEAMLKEAVMARPVPALADDDAARVQGRPTEFEVRDGRF